MLEKTSKICNMIARRDANAHAQMYERAVLPIKVWTEEDYPRLIQVFIYIKILIYKDNLIGIT